MPEIREYTVIEVRKVRVSANNPRDAVRIGACAFDHGQNSSQGILKEHAPEGIWGNTTHAIRVISLHAEEGNV